MGSKWTFKSLNELGVQLIDCMHKTPSAQVTGVPYIGIPQMKNGEIDFEASPRLISESDYKLWTEKANPQYGDIILSRRCNPGETAFVSGQTQFALGQNLVILRTNGLSITAEYLRWALNSSYWWDEVEKYKNPGAIFDSLKCGDIPNFQIPAPPLRIQNKISSVLDLLTDRINLSNKVNKTLEQMSQTLFKSWFVDFDPVIDNALNAGNPIPEALQFRAELRQKVRNSTDFKPLPTDVRVLFPAEFEETELGWIPKGWQHKNAEEIATISIGKTPPRNNKECFSVKEDNNYTWVSIKDLGNCNVFIKKSSEYLTTDAVNNYNVKVVPKGAVLLSFKLTIGRIAIAANTLTTNEAIAHFHNMKQDISKEYLYSYLQQFDYNSLGSTSSIATAVNSKIIKKIPVLVPDAAILKQYKTSTDIIFKRIYFNNENTHNLIALRDTLLPKLISGELSLEDLPDLIKQTEAA